MLGRSCEEKHDEAVAVNGQNQKGDQPADDLERKDSLQRAFSNKNKQVLLAC